MHTSTNRLLRNSEAEIVSNRNNGLGLNRKSGCANVHSTRRVISPGEYFLARRFSLTSSMASQKSVRSRTILAIIKRPRSASHKTPCHVERSETSLFFFDMYWALAFQALMRFFAPLRMTFMRGARVRTISQSSGVLLRRRAPIHKRRASARRFVAMKILLLRGRAHDSPLWLRSLSLISAQYVSDRRQFPPELVPIRSAALASKPSGRLHSGVMQYRASHTPMLQAPSWEALHSMTAG